MPQTCIIRTGLSFPWLFHRINQELLNWPLWRLRCDFLSGEKPIELRHAALVQEQMEPDLKWVFQSRCSSDTEPIRILVAESDHCKSISLCSWEETSWWIASYSVSSGWSLAEEWIRDTVRTFWLFSLLKRFLHSTLHFQGKYWFLDLHVRLYLLYIHSSLTKLKEKNILSSKICW